MSRSAEQPLGILRRAHRVNAPDICSLIEQVSIDIETEQIIRKRRVKRRHRDDQVASPRRHQLRNAVVRLRHLVISERLLHELTHVDHLHEPSISQVEKMDLVRSGRRSDQIQVLAHRHLQHYTQRPR